MSNPRLRAEPCIALIADMVKSRDVPRAQRPYVQDRFKKFIAHLNATSDDFVQVRNHAG